MSNRELIERLELDPPHPVLVVQSCHSWLLITHTNDGYICATCKAEVVVAANFDKAAHCKPIVQTRKWLASGHPNFNAPKGGDA